MSDWKRRTRWRWQLRDLHLQRCSTRASEGPTPATQALDLNSCYDAQAVRDFFQSADLEHGHALLGREQPDAVTALEEEIMFASEHEQAWELPLQECVCYIPVGDKDWETARFWSHIERELMDYLSSHSLISHFDRAAHGVSAISKDLANQALGLYALLCRTGQIEREVPHVARVGVAVTFGGVCTKMHVDQVTARVLCAYFGEGTEYLDHQSDGPSNSNSAIREGSWTRLSLPLPLPLPPAFAKIREPRSTPEDSELAKCRQGEVFLVKGQKWKGGGEPALHRSPRSSSLRMIARVDIHTAEFAQGLKKSDQANRE